jgi:hypothetical protein
MITNDIPFLLSRSTIIYSLDSNRLDSTQRTMRVSLLAAVLVYFLFLCWHCCCYYYGDDYHSPIPMVDAFVVLGKRVKTPTTATTTTTTTTITTTTTTTTTSSSSLFSFQNRLDDASWQELTKKVVLSWSTQQQPPSAQQYYQQQSQNAVSALSMILDWQQHLATQMDDILASWKSIVETTVAASDMISSSSLSAISSPSFDWESTGKVQFLQATLNSMLDSLQQQQQQHLSSTATRPAATIPPISDTGLLFRIPNPNPNSLPQLPPLHDMTSHLFHTWHNSLRDLPAFNFNTPEIILLSTLLSFLAINHVLLTWGNHSPPPRVPYPLQKYDPLSAQVYFDQRPLQVFQRFLLIVMKSLHFALSLFGDQLANDNSDKKKTTTWQTNMEQRGRELAELLTQLGPTFIKST